MEALKNKEVLGLNGKCLPCVTAGGVLEHGQKMLSLLEYERVHGPMPEGFENIFIPRANNQPPQPEPIVEAGGIQILTHQNFTAVIAAQGMGKTSILEASVAGYINPDCDSLNLLISQDVSGIIVADFERTNIDVWNTYRRIKHRSGLPENCDQLPNVILAGMRAVPRVANRKAIIVHLLENNPCGLLILDGSGDLVADINNLDEAIECRVWLRELTVKYSCSILTTLHPNPGSFKPRGHQGSELIRECEAVLLAKKHEGDTRILTTNFEHGKNRNGADVTVGYQWSDEHRMFVSADIDGMTEQRAAAKKERRRSESRDLFTSLIPASGSIEYSRLVDAYGQGTGKSKPTAKRAIADALSQEIITKLDDGNYRIKI